MAICKRLNRNCRACDAYYKPWHKHENCTECGEPMRCRMPAVYGTKFCPKHGGGYPKSRGTYPGVTLKTGKSSKFPINRLAASFIEATEDPELLSLREPLAVIHIRIQELLEKVNVEEAALRNRSVRDAFDEYKHYRRTNNEVKKSEAFLKLDTEMSLAYDEFRAWDQIFRAIEVRRKLSESEVKRLKEMHQFITKEEAYKFLAKVQAAVIKVLGDHPKLLKRIQFEFIQLTGDGDDDVLEGRRRPEVVVESRDVDTRQILDTRAELPNRREGSDSPRSVSGSLPAGSAD